MTAPYLDTSALAKWYLNEALSDRVDLAAGAEPEPVWGLLIAGGSVGETPQSVTAPAIDYARPRVGR